MPDGVMPGSAHAANSAREGQQIRVTFIPEDIQQPYRTAVAETFTELVIMLQHMWLSTDSYVEIKWEPIPVPTLVEESIPGV